MRSDDPSSSVMLPPPDHTPAIPANGPDCAWLAEKGTKAANSNATAMISERTAPRLVEARLVEARLVEARLVEGRAVLLTRSFPPAAAWNPARRPIPLPRSAVAAELAVCMSAGDGNAHIAFPSDTAGDVCTGGGNLTIGDGQRIAGRGLARSRFGDDGDAPKPVIGRLRKSGSSGHGNRRGENRVNKDSTDAVKAHGIISPMCVMGALFRHIVFKVCCGAVT